MAFYLLGRMSAWEHNIKELFKAILSTGGVAFF
jgi:hypothetical protein